MFFFLLSTWIPVADFFVRLQRKHTQSDKRLLPAAVANDEKEKATARCSDPTYAPDANVYLMQLTYTPLEGEREREGFGTKRQEKEGEQTETEQFER